MPDPASIADSKLVVVFKSLLKRDSTTKERALTEFTSILTEPIPIADDVHWAWTQIYPKLSIDASRSVRVLAHRVQGRLGILLGKRSAKNLKYGVGPWIFGLYDTDRMAANSAQQSIAAVFPTKEKQDSLYMVFRDTLLDLIYVVFAHENVATLSDERYISKEEAEIKYYRTLRSACATFTHLLCNTETPKPDSKTEQKFLQVLEEPNLWKAAYSTDVALSRSVLTMISKLFSSAPKTWAESAKDQAATALISKGLSSMPSTLSVDFLQTLINLTRFDPECWNSVQSKKSPLTRLASYISKGNKGRAEYFWASILALLSLLPASLSPYAYDHDSATAAKNGKVITDAFLEGVLRESGAQASHAWGYYMAVVEKIVVASKAKNTSCLSALFEALTKSFFSDDSPVTDNDAVFKVTGKKTSDIFKVAPEAVQKEIQTIYNDINLEHPSNAAINFLKFAKYALESSERSSMTELRSMVFSLVASVVDSLREDTSDHSKTSLAMDSLKIFGKDILSDAKVQESFISFVDYFFSSYAVLGTQEPLIELVKTFVAVSNSVAPFQSSLQTAQEGLIALDQSNEESITKITNFLNLHPSFTGLLSPSLSFSEFVQTVANKLFSKLSSPLVKKYIQAAILAHDVFVTPSISGNILDLIVASVLKEDHNAETSLVLLQSLHKKDDSFVSSRFQTAEGKSVISQLWKASETHSYKSEIEGLLGQLESFAVSSKSGEGSGIMVLASDITEELKTSTLEEVALLVQRAERLIENSKDEKQQVFELLLLAKESWEEQLKYSYDQGLSPSLFISPVYGNSVFLTAVEETVKETLKLLTSPTLINMAVFTTSIIRYFPELYKSVKPEAFASILTSLAYTSELIDIATGQSSHFYSPDNHDLLDIFSSLTSDIREILSTAFTPLVGKPAVYLGGLLEVPSDANPSFSVLHNVWTSCQGTDSRAFYSSRVLETIFTLVISAQDHGSDLFKKLLNRFERNYLGSFALLNALKHSKVIDDLSYLRNSLLGALVSMPSSQLYVKSLKYFTLFISSLSLQDTSKSGLTFFKLTNFVRTLDGIVTGSDVYDESHGPLLILTAQLYEKISDLFLEDLSLSFWEQFTNIFEPGMVVNNLGSPFSNALVLSLLNLYNKMLLLNSSKMGGEALSTALENNSEQVYDLFLENLNEIEPATNQLEELKSQAFLSVLSTLPKTKELEVDSLYRLLAFDDKSLQILGLALLKAYVSATQKDKSLSFALLKQPINPQETDVESYLLSFELLSLVLESPIGQPESLKRQFLYAWNTIFQFFDTSLASLRQFYLGQLQEGNYINVLLDYIASEIELGLEKDTETIWSIESLDPVVDLNHPNDIERCLWNVYFQALNNAGSLAKAWFLDLKKKKMRMDVENFTSSHISPLVIRNKTETIRRVLDQDNDLIDDTLNVSVSKSGKVVTAYYFIDNQTMEVAFIYPDTYPLKDIQVEGVQLVGVKEKQWRAWILASQSALKFNGGSLLDSLDLFKRNVAMHFDGIEACAICYSILHEDHTQPNKECGTCHNRFHTDCLYRWFKSGSTESCPLCRSESFRIGH